MALATLAGAALMAAYSLTFGTLSPVTLIGVSVNADKVVDANCYSMEVRD